MLDWVLHLGLGFSSFKAHGTSTDIYAVDATRIHARTQLVVLLTDHWLVFSNYHDEPSQVDWYATPLAPNTLLLQASQIITLDGLNMWGTGHGTFHRLAE
jgi:hypothetical protein